MLKKKLDFNEGLQQYRLALEYQSYGAYIKAIEILKQILYDIETEKNSSEEIHLLAIVGNSLAKTYMERGTPHVALYYFNKSISHINTLLTLDKQNINLHQSKASIFINIARIYSTLDKHDKSTTYSKEAMEEYELFTKLKRNKHERRNQ